MWKFGQCVLIQVQGPGRNGPASYCPAQILDVWKSRGGAKMAEVRWFYEPHEIPHSRLKHGNFEEGEIFETDHIDQVELETVEMEIKVLGPEAYSEEDDAFDETEEGLRAVYLCQKHYDVNLKTFRPLVEPESAPARQERGLLYSKRRREGRSSCGNQGGLGPSENFHGDQKRVTQLAKSNSVPSTRQCLDKQRQTSELNAQMSVGEAFDWALARLSAAWVPGTLPCRQEERARVYLFLEKGLRQGGHDAPLYVSGMPGTGKTATAHECLRALRRQFEMEKNSNRLEKLPDFDFVEINGMRLAHPNQAYSLIWQTLSGETLISPQRALRRLEDRFSSSSGKRAAPKREAAAQGEEEENEGGGGGGGGKGAGRPGGWQRPRPCVVLLDELDYMVTAQQDVLYNLFDWPSRPNSQLVVVGVANTMDLTERLNQRVASRMGKRRVIFRPYTREQVEQIIQNRLAELKGSRVGVEPGGLKMIGMKVANVSGDVRRALQICRYALRVARKRCRAEGKQDEIRVTIKDVQKTTKEIFESTLNQTVKTCAKYEKLLLIAMACEQHAKGKEQLDWSGVQLRFRNFCQREAPTADEVDFVMDSLEDMRERLRSECIIQVTPIKDQLDPTLSLSNIGSIQDFATILKDDKLAQKYLPEDVMRIHQMPQKF